MDILKKLKEIEPYKKPGCDAWTVLCQKLATPLVALIVNTKITPNQLTVGSLVLIILASFFIASREYSCRIWGVVIMQAGYILDCADGQLARYKKIFSPFGPWLDSFSDRIKEFALVSALTISLSRTHDYAAFFGLALLFLIFLYHGQEIAKLPMTGEDEKSKAEARERGVLKALNSIRKKLKLSPFNIGEQYLIITVFLIIDRVDILFYVLIIYGALVMCLYPLYKYYQYRISK